MREDSMTWPRLHLTLTPLYLFIFIIFSSPIATSQTSAVIYVDQLPDADLGGKLNDCIGKLPSSGGVCDARVLGGAQAITSTVNMTSKPVQILLSAGAITVSASIGFELGSSSSIVGLTPGPGADISSAFSSTIIKSGSGNTVLVRSNATFNGVSGTLNPAITLRNLTIDGNSLSGVVGLQLFGAARSRLENITVQNCAGEQVQMKAIFDTTWHGGVVVNGQSTGIHIMDNGSGSGSGNLQLRGLIVASNGGDGIIFEGSGAGQVFSGIDLVLNRGAGLRIQAESTGAASGVAPVGFTLDTMTFESNGSSSTPGQLIFAGGTGDNGSILSVTANQLTFNGQAQGFTPSSTAIYASQTRNLVFISPFLFNSTNSFNFTNTSFATLLIYPRSSDSSFYASGSSGAMVLKPVNAHFAVGNTFPYDSLICDSAVNTPCGIRGGTASNSSRLFVTDPSFAGNVNFVSNGGGASVAINNSPSAEFRIVKTSDGINYSVVSRTDVNGSQTLSGNLNVGGNLNVSGTISKGGGSFRIDHPLDPANKYLSHSFVESPDMKNIYDGVVVLDSKGEAEVRLPDWFQVLNKDFRYQLTCVGGYANIYIADEIHENRFRIAGGRAGLKVSWQLTGTRHDAFAESHRIAVEEEKPAAEKGLVTTDRKGSR